MKQRIFLLTTLVLICAAACQTQKPPTINNESANIAVSNSVNQTANAPATTTDKTENAAVQKLGFDAPDGMQIVGAFYRATKENSPAVLMLHQYGGNRADYDRLARQFQANGIGVLAIDGRGFGESNKRADGSKVAPSQSNETVAAMKSDVAAAVKFLGEQMNVDKRRIGIIGASYGSSLAIIHAADNAEIKSVSLLSPGTNYFGNLPTEPAIEKYGARPVLIVAAEDDEESATASRQLDKIAAGDKHQLQIYPKGGHGTGIFASGVGLEKLLLDFFRQNL